MLIRLWVAAILCGVFCVSHFAQNSPVRTSPIIEVGRNVQVSSGRADEAHYEVLLSAEPTNPGYLLGSSMTVPKGPGHRMFDTVVYASTDGGATWKETLHVGEGWQVADPTCAFGPGGAAYVTFLIPGDPETRKASRMVFYRSSDYGFTWAEPLALPLIDREYLTVDHSGGKYAGRIYLHGTGHVNSIAPEGGKRVSDIDIFRSLDGGKSFVGPAKLAAMEEGHVVEGMGNGVVLSDGTFIAVTGELLQEKNYFQRPPFNPIGRILAITSEDGGETYGPARKINDWFVNFDHKVTSGLVPVVAADTSSGPFKDRVYVVWPDLRNGRLQVLLSYSSDKGKTWSAPVVASDEPGNPDDTDAPDSGMPTVAVNAAGVVGVMWYDRRDNADNLGYWPRFAASLDGGMSFLPSVRISEGRSDLSDLKRIPLYSAPGSRGGGSFVGASKTAPLSLMLGVGLMIFSGGHTSGLAATADGVFHPLWIDNRSGISQVWTTSIKVREKAGLNGPAGAAGLEDVTSSVALELDHAFYDRARQLVSMEVYASNTGTREIRGPMQMRLLGLSSRLGAIAVENADNGLAGPGAIWDFTASLEGGSLKPGQRARARLLSLRLAEWPRALRDYNALMRMIELRAQFLASLGPPARESK